jgi:Xaa-Pro aminopeptidase
MFSLPAIQSALQELAIDAWLLYDFRGSNVLARRVMDLEDRPVTSRRFFYLVPQHGEPRKLVHRIETGVLDHLPGEARPYLRWQALEAGLAEMLRGRRRVAMEYSPRNANPYISRVDAGTVELVRGLGVEVVPSGDLIQMFEATWDDEQWQLHLEAARGTRAAFDRAFGFIADQVRAHGATTEAAVQQVILDHFQQQRLATHDAPIVAVGPNSGNPHYETSAAHGAPIAAGDFVLIDLWGKMAQPRSVYSDLTRVGYVGEHTPARYAEVFAIVASARDAAIDCVREAFAAGRPLAGWQVDQAARDVIEQAGYGQYFIHRTGHSIGQETHGNGANMDNLETHDERRVLRRTCFSIEPGIYLPEFGIRSEVNVFIGGDGQVHVTGGEPQTQVLAILGSG